MHSSLFHIKTRGGVCVHGNDLTAAAVCNELQLEMFGREGARSTPTGDVLVQDTELRAAGNCASVGCGVEGCARREEV